jgi:hypothetical protein
MNSRPRADPVRDHEGEAEERGGEPHTAGRANLVHFFSGKSFPEGAGIAAVAGLNVYGDSCLAQGTLVIDVACDRTTMSGPE